MGITKLADLIRLDAPGAISHKDISDYTGKVIALDTSIVMNQFRAATPSLSPLTGLFFRTLTFLEHDIKPVFVFDGKPPGEKTAALEKRAETAGLSSPNLTGTASSQTKDCLQLLKLLGVPVIQAPGDAEAMCAWLVREGTVDAVASEDMDTLPDVIEYSLPKLLEKLQISHEEFVDLCILLGCDYCDKIAGLGPRRALTLIQKHRTIENVVLHINRETHPVPHFWKFQEARKIFLSAPPAVAPELTWTEPDEEALVRLLCHIKHREEREKERAAGRSKQTRMEDFFRVTRKREQTVEAADSLSSKRKRPKSK
ncbi:hypothetical protein FQN60_016609 [Etheostoma spectabile]|uniref:XPG-I domain-containing protein n=1 Tax=Etheostoma spectabile TaxID=54343 RepID=A0A5J5D1A9_9PERO|nr:hypothetical protein FQN60_016609 [Etheostoma spectabile]